MVTGTIYYQLYLDFLAGAMTHLTPLKCYLLLRSLEWIVLPKTQFCYYFHYQAFFCGMKNFIFWRVFKIFNDSSYIAITAPKMITKNSKKYCFYDMVWMFHSWIMQQLLKGSFTKNYSPSCLSKPMRPSFIFGKQIQILLMTSESFLSLHRHLRNWNVPRHRNIVRTSLKWSMWYQWFNH